MNNIYIDKESGREFNVRKLDNRCFIIEPVEGSMYSILITAQTLETDFIKKEQSKSNIKIKNTGSIKCNTNKPIPKDMVNHPPHYQKQFPIECIEVTELLMFCPANVFKYIYRAGAKDNYLEDIKKAHWYAKRCAKKQQLPKDPVAIKLIKLVANGYDKNSNLYHALHNLTNGDLNKVIYYLEEEIKKHEGL